MAAVWIEKKKTKSGMRRYVRWIEGGRKHSTPAGPLAKTAKDIAHGIREKLLKKKHHLTDGKLIVKDLVAEYLKDCATNMQPSTIQQKKYALAPFVKAFGDEKVADLESMDIEKMKQILLQRVDLLDPKADNFELKKKKTYNGAIIILIVVKSCLNYAIRMGYIEKSPAKHILRKMKPKPVARFLTDEEIGKLLHACQYNRRLGEIVFVALHSGMREGELINIDSAKISGDRILIHQKKTDKNKLIPYHKEVAEILTRGKPFESWTKDRLVDKFKRAWRRADIGPTRFHDLRHTFASIWLRNGGSMAELKELLGVTFEALEVYSHAQDSHLKERLDRIKFSPIGLQEIFGKDSGKTSDLTVRNGTVLNSSSDPENTAFTVDKEILR